MKITQHPTRRFYDEGKDHQRDAKIMVSLREIPGVIIDSARPETAPRGCPIRYDAKPPRVVTGAAALALSDRRLDVITGAILAARSGIANEVTL